MDTDKFSTMNLQAELAANLGELLKEDSPKQPQKPEISRAEHPKEPEVMLEELDLSELTVPELDVPEPVSYTHLALRDGVFMIAICAAMELNTWMLGRILVEVSAQ